MKRKILSQAITSPGSESYGTSMDNASQRALVNRVGNNAQMIGKFGRGPYDYASLHGMAVPVETGTQSTNDLTGILGQAGAAVQIARVFASDAQENDLIGGGGIVPLIMTDKYAFTIERMRMKVVLPTRHALYGDFVQGTYEKTSRSVVLSNYGCGISVSVAAMNAPNKQSFLQILAEIKQISAGVRDHLMIEAYNVLRLSTNWGDQLLQKVMKDLGAKNQLTCDKFLMSMKLLPGVIQWHDAPLEFLAMFVRQYQTLVQAQGDTLVTSSKVGDALPLNKPMYNKAYLAGPAAPGFLTSNGEQALASRTSLGLHVVPSTLVNDTDLFSLFDDHNLRIGEFGVANGFGSNTAVRHNTENANVRLYDSERDDYVEITFRRMLIASGRWELPSGGKPSANPDSDDSEDNDPEQGAQLNKLGMSPVDRKGDSMYDAEGRPHRMWGQQKGKHLTMDKLTKVARSCIENLGPLSAACQNGLMSAAIATLRRAKATMEGMAITPAVATWLQAVADANSILVKGPGKINAKIGAGLFDTKSNTGLMRTIDTLPSSTAGYGVAVQGIKGEYSLPPCFATAAGFRAIRTAVSGAHSAEQFALSYGFSYSECVNVSNAFSLVEELAEQLNATFPGSAAVSPVYASNETASAVDTALENLIQPPSAPSAAVWVRKPAAGSAAAAASAGPTQPPPRTGSPPPPPPPTITKKAAAAPALTTTVLPPGAPTSAASSSSTSTSSTSSSSTSGAPVLSATIPSTGASTSATSASSTSSSSTSLPPPPSTMKLPPPPASVFLDAIKQRENDPLSGLKNIPKGKKKKAPAGQTVVQKLQTSEAARRFRSLNPDEEDEEDEIRNKIQEEYDAARDANAPQAELDEITDRFVAAGGRKLDLSGQRIQGELTPGFGRFYRAASAQFVTSAIDASLAVHLNNFRDDDIEGRSARFFEIAASIDQGRFVASVDQGHPVPGFNAESTARALGSAEFAKALVDAGIMKTGTSTRQLVSQISSAISAAPQRIAAQQHIGVQFGDRSEGWVRLPLLAGMVQLSAGSATVRFSALSQADEPDDQVAALLVAEAALAKAHPADALPFVVMGNQMYGANKPKIGNVKTNWTDTTPQPTFGERDQWAHVMAATDLNFRARIADIVKMTDPVLRFAALCFATSSMHWGVVDSMLMRNTVVPLTVLLMRTNIDLTTSSAIVCKRGAQNVYMAMPLKMVGSDAGQQRGVSSFTFSSGSSITVPETLFHLNHILITDCRGGFDATLATGGQYGTIAVAAGIQQGANRLSSRKNAKRGSIVCLVEPLENGAKSQFGYGASISAHGSWAEMQKNAPGPHSQYAISDSHKSHFCNTQWLKKWFGYGNVAPSASARAEQMRGNTLGAAPASQRYIMFRAGVQERNPISGEWVLTQTPTGCLRPEFYGPGMVPAWRSQTPYKCARINSM